MAKHLTWDGLRSICGAGLWEQGEDCAECRRVADAAYCAIDGHTSPKHDKVCTA